MKKAFALLLALALVGGAVFAEDVAYTLSGSATLTWGYDLNTESHGFTNESEALLEVTFITEASDTQGDTPITGSIMIEEFSLVYDTDDGLAGASGDVTAKILFPSGLYMQIASAPSFEVENASFMEPWVTDDDYEAASAVAPEITSAGGFTLGMDGDLSFAFKVGSTNTHDYEASLGSVTYVVKKAAAATTVKATDDFYLATFADAYTPDGTKIYAIGAPYATGAVIAKDTMYFAATTVAPGAAAADDYMIGFDLGYAVGDLATIGANFIFGAFDADDPVVGLGVSVDATPIENLAVYLGTDFDLTIDTLMDLQFSADYTMPELVSFGFGTYVALNLDADEGNPWMDARVRASLLAVPNLTLDVGVDLRDVLDTTDTDADMVTLLGLNAAYEAAIGEGQYVKPYAAFEYYQDPKELAMNLGVEFMLFPMTTFDINFTAGEVADYSVTSGTFFGDDSDKGVFTVSVTIEY